MPQTTFRSHKGVSKYDKKYGRYDEKDRSRDYKMGGNALFRKVGGTKKYRRCGSRTYRRRM
jgi:hypothetical protein